MVQIKPFVVEEWMDRLENTPGSLNVAETCCDSVSIRDLQNLSTDKTSPGPLEDIVNTRMTYGAILGSDTTRERIADLYNQGVDGADASKPLTKDEIIIAQGAIASNYLLLYSLVGPGDHVVCVYPTYQQLYDVPQSLGAEVSLWKLKEQSGYIPDVAELDSLVQQNTKMIIINNPNNPTGSTIPRDVLQSIVDFAKARGIIVFADEVYRPLFHSLPAGTPEPPSIISMGYDRTVSTSSMSKTWSLAGVRLGWIATRDIGILRDIESARNYTTISVSQLDDRVAGYALSDTVRPSLLQRNLDLARINIALLDDFIRQHPESCSWVKPTAGTTAMVRFQRGGRPVSDGDFCLEILKETGVLAMPGSTCFGNGEDFEGHMRFGYVSSTEVLKEALDRLGKYLKDGYIQKA